MNKIRIKICGIKTHDVALKAIECGSDALGFVFYQKSPRYISYEEAAKITTKLPSMVNKVGVFVTQTEDEILKAIEITGIDTIQLHGEISLYNPDFVANLKEKTKLPIIYAIRTNKISKEFFDLPITQEILPLVSNILVDKLNTKEYGGTGERIEIDKNINQNEILSIIKEKVILAGGINASNIKEILNEIKPYAIDISSGVEREKGIKDIKLIENFFSTLNQYLKCL